MHLMTLQLNKMIIWRTHFSLQIQEEKKEEGKIGGFRFFSKRKQVKREEKHK